MMLPLKTEEYKRGLKCLNIGCGKKRFPGAVNVDIRRTEAVDLVHDLNKIPWPFEDGYFDRVMALDILEHLDDLIITMEEIYRITKAGVLIQARTNFWQSEQAFTDPTHKMFFTPHSFDYFDPTTAMGKQYDFYSSARFKIEKCQVEGEELYWELIRL